MNRGGSRKGAGRPSAFPHGTVLEGRTVRLPVESWAALDARAKEQGTTVPGLIAALATR